VNQHRSRQSFAVAAIVAGTLLVSACGSSSSATGSAATSPAASSAESALSSEPSPEQNATTLDTTLAEYSVSVKGASHLKPGTYTFHVSNTGDDGHNLTVEGPGVEEKATPTFPGGETRDLTVTLQSGKYELYCSVPGHKQAGMETDIEVS